MLCLGKKENMKSLTPDELQKLEEFRIRSNDFIITALAYDKAKAGPVYFKKSRLIRKYTSGFISRLFTSDEKHEIRLTHLLQAIQEALIILISFSPRRTPWEYFSPMFPDWE
ncbi:MAG: hypothetical protein MZU97_26910 [Bacillus subtilis]|nr:hypothetical protein [Bacillus subtilis]